MIKRCPTLQDLPAPLSNKTGFPWTEESPQLPDLMPNGKPYPSITIVTPSYQQGQFIEETIRSVLLQGYPSVEFIIMDGGSKDESVEVIKRYEAFISSWVSEPDRGQSHAINKGWEISTGDVLHYLNSDDVLVPGALKIVADAFASEENVEVVSGISPVLDAELKTQIRTKLPRDFDIKHFLMGLDGPGQPATFIVRAIYESVGGIDESLYYTMDREFWTRISLLHPDIHQVKLQIPLALTRSYAACKSAQGAIAFSERMRIIDKMYAMSPLPEHVQQMKTPVYTENLWGIALFFKSEKQRLQALTYYLKTLYWNPRYVKHAWKFVRELV